jgi:hypothetical protein
MTVTDCVEISIEDAAQRALDVAWDGADAVWLSFDVDCLDVAFVPGTGWPEPGGFLPREVLSVPSSSPPRATPPITARCCPRSPDRCVRGGAGAPGDGGSAG